jgi:hypothetical protein
MNLSQTKTIINSDHPACLYCNKEISAIETSNKWAGSFQKREMKLYCDSCDEFFTLSGLEDEDADYLKFTCKSITVHVHFNTNYILLDKNNDFENATQIVKFEMNFSDKEKLYNKLSTYIIFS